MILVLRHLLRVMVRVRVRASSEGKYVGTLVSEQATVFICQQVRVRVRMG